MITLARDFPGQDKAQVATSSRRAIERRRVHGESEPAASVTALLPAARYLGVRRADRARRHMAQDLVEQRGWISAQEYKRASPLAARPGPARGPARDLPRWVRGRVLRATLAGIAFVAPRSHVLVLSALYAAYGGLPWMQGCSTGSAAAVIAIIARMR